MGSGLWVRHCGRAGACCHGNQDIVSVFKELQSPNRLHKEILHKYMWSRSLIKIKQLRKQKLFSRQGGQTAVGPPRCDYGSPQLCPVSRARPPCWSQSFSAPAGRYFYCCRSIYESNPCLVSSFYPKDSLSVIYYKIQGHSIREKGAISLLKQVPLFLFTFEADNLKTIFSSVMWDYLFPYYEFFLRTS